MISSRVLTRSRSPVPPFLCLGFQGDQIGQLPLIEHRAVRRGIQDSPQGHRRADLVFEHLMQCPVPVAAEVRAATAAWRGARIIMKAHAPGYILSPLRGFPDSL